MTIKLPKAEKPAWMPPFVWSLLGADDPASQVSGLANPLGFGSPVALGAVRTLQAGAAPVVEYTGQDILPRLLEVIGPKAQAAVEPIAKNAIERRALLRYAEAKTPHLLEVLQALKRQGTQGWEFIPSIPDALAQRGDAELGGVFVERNKGILANHANPKKASLNTLHELLHAAEYGVDKKRLPWSNSSQRLLHSTYEGLGNPYPPLTNATEAVVEIPARYLLGMPYGTRTAWTANKPLVDELVKRIIGFYQ